MDNFISNNPIPELIKIDTEGHEFDVLKGSINLIKNHKPFIIFESLMMKFLIFNRNNYYILNIKNNYNLYNSKLGNENNLLACPAEKVELFQKL